MVLTWLETVNGIRGQDQLRGHHPRTGPRRELSQHFQPYAQSKMGQARLSEVWNC